MKDLFKNKIGNFNHQEFIQVNLDRLKALLPKEKPSINIGLDIGSSSVKAVAIKLEKDKAELINYSIKPFDRDYISDSINKTLKDLNIENKTVNISIGGQGVVTRSVKFPRMSLSEVKNAIGFESEKHIPFPLNEVYMDCFIMRQLPEENKMLVLVAAAKKELIQHRLAYLKPLSLTANFIDVDSLALVNLINRIEFKPQGLSTGVQNAEQKKAVALLNLGATFTSLCIVENGIPKFVRDIFIGGNDLTKRISNILGTGLAEADKAKCSPQEGWDKISAACESVLNNLINETRLSFDYFESDSGINISCLYLSGGGSYLRGIDEIIKTNLNVEVKYLNPAADLKVSESFAGGLETEARKLSIAIGLALRIK
ncbi:MAG: type IV pilus assembly protein PilM [Candidatus Omnitrophica bacterium]|nr:type IV pilus assembly protein PilM [Candidatus Omnitrophota bacterium]